VTKLILASASPARTRLLTQVGIAHEVIVSGVDESTVDASNPERLASVLAGMKAAAVAEQLRGEELVLGCDSVLSFDGVAYGKPENAGEAIRRWQQLRGHSGVLYTGHCLIDVPTRTRIEAVAETTVHFGPITDVELERYVATGEPLQVAGAFTIDGLCGPFIERIEGDHGNVIGLSLPLLRDLLGALDMSVTDFWA
jgi:septum formation protein